MPGQMEQKKGAAYGYTKLGNSKLNVSCICMGFGDAVNGYRSDTRKQYVGRALRDFAKRDEMVGATKLHHIFLRLLKRREP